MKINLSLIGDQRSLRRVSGEAPGRLPTCPRRWAERAAAGEGPTACLGRQPRLAVSTKTPANGKGEGPSTVRPLTGARLRLGEIRTSFGVQALPGAGTVATCIGPPQPNASAVNGLSTAENLPCGSRRYRLAEIGQLWRGRPAPGRPTSSSRPGVQPPLELCRVRELYSGCLL